MKFKVGDKVRYIAPHDFERDPQTGDICIVKAIDEDDKTINVRPFGLSPWWHNPEEFELVEEGVSGWDTP